ncbi:nucleus accumbens-associated protein 2 [Sigmodon hispidus]
MNVIAADMCTNAPGVRKRWMPKIKSMLPEGVEMYHTIMGASAASLPLDPEFPPAASQASKEVDAAGSVIQEVAAPEQLLADGQSTPHPQAFEQGNTSSRSQTLVATATRRPEGTYAGTL